MSFQLIESRDAEIIDWLNTTNQQTSTLIRNTLKAAAILHKQSKNAFDKSVPTSDQKQMADNPIIQQTLVTEEQDSKSSQNYMNQDDDLASALMKMDQEFN